jgi:hypothetical protein
VDHSGQRKKERQRGEGGKKYLTKRVSFRMPWLNGVRNGNEGGVNGEGDEGTRVKERKKDRRRERRSVQRKRREGVRGEGMLQK